MPWRGVNLLLAAVLLSPAGCRKAVEDVRSAAQRAEDQNTLKWLFICYDAFAEKNKRSPRDLEDFEKGLPTLGDIANDPKMAPKYLQEIRSGKFVVLWDVNLQAANLGAGRSGTVLAYEKDTPDSGGLVLFADGSVVRLTAEQFKAKKLPQHK
jgi:hypothetical protein